MQPLARHIVHQKSSEPPFASKYGSISFSKNASRSHSDSGAFYNYEHG